MFTLRIFCLIIFTGLSNVTFCQGVKSPKLKVFVDCKNVGCDFNFIRTEITVVDFVLDRVAADVHILLTGTRSGNGGNNVQYIFYGQNTYSKFADTLKGNISPNLTGVESRSEVVRKIKQGLMPFLMHTPYADFLDINMKVKGFSDSSLQLNPTKDKWNYWVFNVGSDGNYNAEQVYKSMNINGHVNANRTTEKSKLRFSSNGGYHHNSYTYQDRNGTRKRIVENSNFSIDHHYIKSITGHWSAGYEASYSNNTFNNNKSRKHFRTAVEYAIFPYKEVNNKFFTINYGVDVRQNNYYDTTIYNKISETLFGHRAQAYLSLRQKWGSVNSSISYSNFFNNWTLNHLSASLNINVRITGGLSFYIHSRGSLVHDQVYLVKGTATEEDILIRRRQIASAYNFFSGVGLNYRFGSILNNFVNPRFDHP